jgi:hypothetical protein
MEKVKAEIVDLIMGMSNMFVLYQIKNLLQHLQ